MDMLDLVVDEIKDILSRPRTIVSQVEDDNDEFDFSNSTKDNVDTSWFSEFE